MSLNEVWKISNFCKKVSFSEKMKQNLKLFWAEYTEFAYISFNCLYTGKLFSWKDLRFEKMKAENIWQFLTAYAQINFLYFFWAEKIWDQDVFFYEWYFKLLISVYMI